MIRSLTGSEPDVTTFNYTLMIFWELWVQFWRNEYLPWYIASYNNRLYSVGYWCMSISSSRKISDLWPLSMFVLGNDVWTKKSTNNIWCWWSRGCWIVWNAKMKIIQQSKYLSRKLTILGTDNQDHPPIDLYSNSWFQFLHSVRDKHQSLVVGLDILPDQVFGRANIVWKQHFHNFLRQNYEKSHKFQWSSKISLTYDTIESDLSRNIVKLFLLGMRKYYMIRNKNWMEVLLLSLMSIQRLCSPKMHSTPPMMKE